jgi:hypothetical protein
VHVRPCKFWLNMLRKDLDCRLLKVAVCMVFVTPSKFRLNMSQTVGTADSSVPADTSSKKLWWNPHAEASVRDLHHRCPTRTDSQGNQSPPCRKTDPNPVLPGLGLSPIATLQKQNVHQKHQTRLPLGAGGFCPRV